MVEKIKIGEKEMEFKSSAATPILYKKLYKEDLLVDLSSLKGIKDKYQQGAKMTELVDQLAYIMYAEANLSANELFMKLNLNDYIAWLMSIETAELEKNSASIIKLYQGNTSTTSTTKNE